LLLIKKGGGLSEHTTLFDALVYIIDGEAGITIAGQLNVVKNSELLIMPVIKPHALKAKEKFKMMLVMIKS
jgi:quercetin dioxygenase-like cupin family protein